MKRFWSSVLIFLMVFSTIVIPVEVSAADALMISADTQSAEAGETVTITLSASNNPGLSFLQVTLQYDTSVLTLESATNGNVFSTFEKGVNLQWSSDEDSTNNGTLATLKFKVTENAAVGSYAVNAIFREAYDSDINDVAVVVNPGAVIVTSELVGKQTVAVTAPVKGAVPQATIAAGSGYTGTIAWEGNPTKFAADTVYVANITLTAADWYVFAPTATGSVSGATVTNNSVSSDGSTLTFKATFPNTAGKDTPACTAPANVTATYGQKLSDITLTNPAGNTTGTWTWAAPTTSVGNVGTKTFKATFTPTNTNDYVAVENIDVSVTVKPKPITVTVDNIADQQYTGSQIKPTVTVKGDGKTLVLNTDYTVEYGTNKNVGATGGSVTVKAKSGSNYTFSNTTENFNIVAQAGQVTISGNLNVTYPNTVPNATIDKHGSDGSVTVYYYTNEACTSGRTTTKPTNTGNYWAKAEMAAGTNYGSAVSNVLAFTISRASITPSVSIANWTYLGNASTPSVTGNTGNGTVTYQYKAKDANDNTYTATVPTKAGDYTIKATVAQSSNYNGATATADFKINPKNISEVTIDAIADQTYTGNAITPKPSVKDGITPLVLDTDFTYSYENNTNVSTTATVKVVGKGNYTGTASKTFTIIRKDLSITVSITGWTVGGTPNAPAVTGNLGNGAVTYQYKVKGAADSTYSATVPTAVGNYTVKATVAQTANYNGATATTDFAISTKSAQNITADNVTVTYGDSGKKVSGTTNGNGTISYAVKSGSDVVEVNSTTGALTIKKVGTATITVTASETTSHAAATKDITVTVNPKKITAPAADTTVYTYNGSEQTYKITANDAYTVTGNKQTAANETGYTVTVALKDKVNYQWSDGSTEDQTYTFIIKKASVTAPAANNTTFAYTGKEQTYSLTANDAYTITGNKQTAANETGYTVTVALKDKVNRQWSDGTTDDKTYTFIIKKATITITAKNKSAYTGNTAPTLGDSDYTVTGLVNGETLKTKPTIAYETTPDMSKAGTTNILVSDAVAPDGSNYNDIVYISGTLTIAKDADEYEWLWYYLMVLQSQKFDVTATATAGGEIDPAGVSKVQYSKSITYTITPDAGYAIKSVLVDGEDVGSASEYTFKNVTKKHTIHAVFEQVNPYTDIKADDWFYDDVLYVTSKGLMEGTGNGKFSPEISTDRAMLVTVLWRLEGSPVVDNPVDFLDVADGLWYSDAIDWASANGIVNGYGDGRFGPTDTITREQMATIMWRYAKYKGYDVSVGENTDILSYTDAETVSDWAIPAMQWACSKDMIKGIVNNILDPAGDATRAQIAAILYRFCQTIK